MRTVVEEPARFCLYSGCHWSAHSQWDIPEPSDIILQNIFLLVGPTGPQSTLYDCFSSQLALCSFSPCILYSLLFSKFSFENTLRLVIGTCFRLLCFIFGSPLWFPGYAFDFWLPALQSFWVTECGSRSRRFAESGSGALIQVFLKIKTGKKFS